MHKIESKNIIYLKYPLDTNIKETKLDITTIHSNYSTKNLANIKLCKKFLNNKINYKSNKERNKYFLILHDMIKIVTMDIYNIHMYILKVIKDDNELPTILKKPQNYEEIDKLENLKDLVNKYIIPNFNIIYEYSNKLFSLLSFVNTKVNHEVISNSFTNHMSEMRFYEIFSNIKIYFLHINQYYKIINNTIQDFILIKQIINNNSDLIINSNINQITNIMYYLVKYNKYTITRSLTIENISETNDSINNGNYELYLSQVLGKKIINNDI